MKKFIAGGLMVTMFVIANPSYAASDNLVKGMLLTLVDSLEDFASTLALYLDLRETQPAQLVAADIAEEKSNGKAFGPFVDVTVARDGKGVFEGELNIVVAEDFDAGTAEHFYYLYNRVTDIVLEMTPNTELPSGFEAGAMLRAVGRVNGGKMDVDVAAPAGEEGSIELVVSAGTDVSSAATTRTALAILINTSDASAPCSAATVMNIMENDSGNNVADAFLSASHGELTFSTDVTGPYSVDQLSTDSYSTVGSAGRAAAEAAGVDTTSYDHIIHIIPDDPNNGYIGYGQYNNRYSWMYRCLRDGIEHELGHNLNLGHANRDGREYNDRGSFMGYASVGLRHAHASHMDYLNWLPDAAILYNPGPGTFTLGSSDMYPGDVPYPQAIVLDKPDTNQKYYVSFRTPTGYANNMPSGYDYTIQIHTVGASSRTGTDFKFLSATTPFTDAVNGLTIARLGSSSNEFVNISINSVCTPNQPTVNISPVEVGSSPGETASYNVSVRNNNSTYCGTSNVTLTSSDNSANLSTDLSDSSFTLSAGETRNVTLSATSDSGLTNGSVTLTVEAQLDGLSDSDTSLYTVDLLAPSAPNNLSGTVRKKQVNLTWNSATDNVGVAGYNLYRGEEMIGTVQATSFADKFPVSGTNTYTVEAFDAAGNTSPMSNVASVDFSKGGGKGGGSDSDDGSGKPEKCTPWPSCR